MSARIPRLTPFRAAAMLRPRDPARDTALELEPLEWARGAARFEGEDVILLVESADRYFVESGWGRELNWAPVADLACLQVKSDVLAFVKRHGLLRTPPDAADHRESLSFWWEEARKIQTAVFLYRFAKSAYAGDSTAVRELRDSRDGVLMPAIADYRAHMEGARDVYREVRQAVDQAADEIGDKARPERDLILGVLDRYSADIPENDQLLAAAEDEVARILSDGMARYAMAMTLRVVERENFLRPAGRWVLRLRSRTLLGQIYQAVALVVASNLLVRSCADILRCRKTFLVHDQRQKFCSVKCANRVRQRARRESGAGHE